MELRIEGRNRVYMLRYQNVTKACKAEGRCEGVPAKLTDRRADSCEAGSFPRNNAVLDLPRSCLGCHLWSVKSAKNHDTEVNENVK